MIGYLEKENLIVGCGNILFGDDGFGPTVISKLNELKKTKKELKYLDCENIGIIDAGTAASHFIISLIDEQTKIKKMIIVDIIDYKLKPGELKKLTINDLPNIPKYYIDAHNMPLAGMLIDISKNYNIKVSIIGCQYKYISAPDIHLGLSTEVSESIYPAIDMILNELDKNE